METKDTANRTARPRRLNRRQHAFIREKVLGLNDKEAALAAGYAFSVAENTRQKLWKPQVRAEFERLKARFRAEPEPNGSRSDISE